MIRRAMIGFPILILLFLSATAVAEKTFESTWTSPDAQSVDLTGKKIAALVLSRSMATRTAAEDMLAKQITGHGAAGIAGYTLVTQSDMSDREKVKSLLAAAGAEGAVVIRPVLAGGRPSEPYMKESAEYQKFMGFSDEAEGDLKKKARFYVEVYLYSISQDKLMWVGRSATKATTADELISDITNGVVEQLDKDGLIQKK